MRDLSFGTSEPITRCSLCLYPLYVSSKPTNSACAPRVTASSAKSTRIFSFLQWFCSSGRTHVHRENPEDKLCLRAQSTADGAPLLAGVHMRQCLLRACPARAVMTSCVLQVAYCVVGRIESAPRKVSTQIEKPNAVMWCREVCTRTAHILETLPGVLDSVVADQYRDRVRKSGELWDLATEMSVNWLVS